MTRIIAQESGAGVKLSSLQTWGYAEAVPA